MSPEHTRLPDLRSRVQIDVLSEPLWVGILRAVPLFSRRFTSVALALSLVAPAVARADDRDPTVAPEPTPAASLADGEDPTAPAASGEAGAAHETLVDAAGPDAPPEPKRAPEPEPEPEPEPGEDELGPRMVRVGVGMTILGATMAATSAGLWIGSAVVNRKIRNDDHDGVLNGTEDDAIPTEDPDELERRDALRTRGYRLNRATATTGIPAAVFLTAGVLMLAFSPKKKAPRRISFRPSASPVGGGAMLVAGF